MKVGTFWRLLATTALLAVAVFFFIRVWTVLIPFFIGFALAYFVQPVIARFEARGLRRDRVVIVVYVAMISLLAILAVSLLPGFLREARSIGQELPSYAQSFDGMVARLNQDIARSAQGVLGKKAASFQISLRAEKMIDELIESAPHNLLNVAHFGLWIIIIPFVAFFVLTQGRAWVDAIFDMTPAAYVESLLGMLAEINATLGAYIRGQMLEGACVGLVTMAGLAIFHFDGAILFGALTGLMNLVPMMAPIVGGGLALLVGYFQGLSTTSLIGIFFLFVLVRLLDDFIFIPFVLGQSVRLHPVLIVFSVLAGFEIGGFFGLVLAVPVAAIIKVVLSLTIGERRLVTLVDERHIVS
jgi:predicted PurR-regulated permease PerM